MASADSGLSLMRELAQLTGADVAASNDLTGHSSLGGNWVLEARVGEVDTQIFASQGLLQSYRATLAAPVANDDNGDSYSEVVEGISDGYFRLGDAGNIADETAGGNDGTAVGGVSTGTGGATGDGDDSITLNGTDGYVSIPHSADYELNAGAISLWFNSTTIADGDTLFSKDASGTAEGGHLTIRFTGSGAAAEIEVRLQNNTASGTDSHFVYSDLPAGYLNDGNWHNIVFTFGPAGMALYVDGAAADTTGGNAHLDIYDGGMAGDTGLQGDGGDTPNQEPIALGASRRTSASGMTPASGGFFQGSIDELAIVNQQLTAAQVAELYSTPGVPYEIDEDNALAVDAANGVLVNDTDADDDPLTASLVSGPGNAASFTLNSDGSFSYTPEANFSGTDSFIYQADDGNGGTDTATATITVNAVADDPSLWDYHQTVTLATPTPSANYLVEIALANVVNGFQYSNADANGDDLRFYDSSGNDLDYFIQSWNVGGTSSVWVEVADAGTTEIDFYYGNPDAVAKSTGSAGTGTIVTALSDEGFSIDENSPNTTPVGTVLAEDVDGDGLTFTISSGNTDTAFAIDNAGLITVANSSAVNFEVNPTFALTVEVGDGTGRTDTSTVNISLNDINDPAVGPVTVTLLDDDGDSLPEQGERLSQAWVADDEDGVPGAGWDITWLRDGVPIPGATNATYTLTQDDVGAQITSTVSFTDLGGNAEYLTSTPTVAIGNINDAPTGSVTVSGIVGKDETLSVTDDLADIDGMGTITYHWQRDTGSGFVDIGATGSTYTLTAADVGANVRAEARYQDLEGTDEVVGSNTVGPVAPGRGADITSIETADLDEDGFIDAIRVTFDDAIQDSTVRADDFDVAGVVGESFSSTTNSDVADDNDIYITFTDGVLSTGDTPEVTYLGDSPTDPDILDGGGNVAADFVAWWNSDWQNRTRIDINNSASATNINGFPLLVELTGADIDFNLISVGGADVRFVDSDGSELPYTIESWDDGSETARIWVRVSQLDAGAGDEAIYLYHNNGAAGDNQDTAAVWADGLGIYHFNEDPGPGNAGDILDSSNPANNGTADLSMTAGDLVSGRVGTGIDFDEIDDHIDFGSVDVGDTFTVSAWIRPDSAGDSIQTILANSAQGASAAGFRLFINSSGTEDGSIHFETGNGSNGDSAISNLGVINFDAWNHVAVEVNRATGNATIYHNGVDVTSDSTIRTDFTTVSDFRVGQMEGDSLEFNGIIDELRVESVGLSADFIQARYLSQVATSSFMRFGATESQTRDAAAPVASITRDDSNPSTATSVSFSVDFSEAVSNVTADDFVITSSGTVTTNPVVAVNNAGDGDTSTYQVTVSGISGDGTLGLALSGGQDIADVAGNLASASLPTSESYTIDNTAPGAAAVTGITNDTNVAADGTTSDNQLVFSGTAEANSSVEVFIDGVSIGTAGADGGGNWSFDHSGTTLADGSYSLTAQATDAAGNTGALSAGFALTVDTSNPAAPTALGISVDTGAADRITSDNQLVFSGSAEANSTVEVFLDSGGGPVSIDTVSADASGNWTVDYTGTTLADGNYTLTARSIDLAGNTGPASGGLAFTVDTAGPAAAATAISDDTGAADRITSDNQLVFNGTAEANNSVEVFLDGASLGSVTADGSGNWSLDYTGTTLADGSYTLTARATDTATGQAGVLSAGMNFTIDTVGPAAAATAISDDTGAADLITLDDRLVFSGTAEANNSVEAFLDGASLGSVTADGSGNWNLDYTGIALADGSYTLTARATDTATGQAGALSGGLSFTVDTAAPSAAVSTITADTNIAADRVTSDNQLVFSGTAEASNSVEVFLDGASLGSVVADGSGNWSLDYTATTLADGSYTLTAQATDTATSETGAVSAGFNFTVDSVAPAAPTVVSLSEDTGAADLITADNQLVFAGTAEPDSQVEVFLDASSIGTASADGSGNWIFDHSATTLADGAYNLTAEATDLAGNTSPTSGAFSFRVDTVPPPNNAPTGSVSIDNTAPAQGDLLTASNDLSDPDGFTGITYHWQRDTGSGFVDIGATGSTYIAIQDDVGATLRVEARYTDLRGFNEAVGSAATAAVANVDDDGSGEVSINNLNPVQGDTLTASNTLDDPDGLSGTVAYQWQRDGEDIPGQNGTIYVTTQADVGAVISVVASYIDDLGGSGSFASVATAPVANVNDAPTGSVVISGEATEDQTLTVSNSLADADGLGAVSYQWQRDGVDISGAVGNSYTLDQADVGFRISVVASYTDSYGTVETLESAGVLATSGSTSVEEPPPGAPPEPRGGTPVDQPGTDSVDLPGGVNIPEEQVNGDSGTQAPITPPGTEDPLEPPPNLILNDPVLDGDIGTTPILELGDNLEIGNRAGTGSSIFNLTNSDATNLDEDSETDAAIADAERDRELVEDLLQLIQDGDTEDDITLASGRAIGATLGEDSEEEEELAVVDDILTNHALWDAIDRMNEEMAAYSDSKLTREELVVQFVSTSGLGLFAAATVYALRGGALMASWLSTVPLWGTLDPLPVLRERKDEDKEELEGSEKSTRERQAESLFSGQEGA
ncbi:MAG: DUF2341 domain-containing protein [Halieaceae bacterium]|nr:DUF2341 domain-containing protein [Halieaceae bacterium]